MTSPVGLWIDWSGAGFGTTAYDDCTALIRSIRYRRGGTPDITGAAQGGSCTIRLLNPGGLFDPDNASGPLYGLLHDGVRVWFGANEDGSISGAGTVRGRFAGRTLDVTPVPQAGAGTSTPEVEITCEDAKGWYARTPVALSVAAQTEDYIPPLPSPLSCPTALGAAVGAHITDQASSASPYSLSVTPSGGSSIIVAGFLAGGTGMTISGTGLTTLVSISDTGHETAALGWALSSSAYSVAASYTNTGSIQAAAMAAIRTSATAPLQTAVSTWSFDPTATLPSPPTPGNMLVAVIMNSQAATPATLTIPGWTRVAEGQANGVHPFGGNCVDVFAKCSVGSDGNISTSTSNNSIIGLMEWPF